MPLDAADESNLPMTLTVTKARALRIENCFCHTIGMLQQPATNLLFLVTQLPHLAQPGPSLRQRVLEFQNLNLRASLAMSRQCK